MSGRQGREASRPRLSGLDSPFMPRVRSDATRPRPRIRPRTFPREDPEFRTAVEAACRGIRGSNRDLIAERVRDALVDRYRRVAVQPQDPLAATADDLVLYVYRDGKPTLARPLGVADRADLGLPHP